MNPRKLLNFVKKTNTLTLVLSGKYKKHLSVTTRYSYNLLIVIKRESFFTFFLLVFGINNKVILYSWLRKSVPLSVPNPRWV